jgi:hypothetical protein
MNAFRAWRFACVAFVAFLCGIWIGVTWHFGVAEARAAESKTDISAQKLKTQSVQFVDDRGLVTAELVVREAKIDGHRSLQLALVDPQGKDVWTGPAGVKILPTRSP